MNVLAIGAHPDDVELGCGATLARHAHRGDEITILVMTDGGLGSIDGMSRRSEQLEAARQLGATLRWGGYEDGTVSDGPDAIRVIDDAIAASGADVLYTHGVDDTHQDHRATATASLAAGRRLTTILQYETPSTRGFDPTLYVDVGDTIEEKLAMLRAHMSQVLRAGPVDLEAIEAQARFRGSQGRIRFAEAFVPVRVSWDLAAPETLAPVVTLEPLASALRSIG
ncbi:MAG TPA: PIG-L deacetylase family protein [Acidimicrobiia bacterium]